MLPTNTHILFHEFDFHAPTTVDQATELLDAYRDDACVMAGGTDLLVQMKMERRHPSQVISLRRIPSLGSLSRNGDLIIGGTASIRAVHQYLSNLSPSAFNTHALAESCNAFSTVQIMHMATLGGNLCNASPAADSAPCLLVLDASVTLKSKTQERLVPLSDFFLGPGKTVRAANEILTRIHIPPPAPYSGSAFLKMSRVVADISQVCAAVSLVRDGNVIRDGRIALGSVAPTPLLLGAASSALTGEPFSLLLAEQVGKIAAGDIKPIDDVRASRAYRQHVAAVLVRDAVLKAWERSSAPAPGAA